MKKSTTSNFWSRLLALTGVLATAVSAHALTDLGQLELDKEYTITDFQEYSGYFVAPNAGELNYRDLLLPYSDAEHNNEIEGNYGGYEGGYQKYTINVNAGQTVYFYNSFVWSGGTFKIWMDAPFALTDLFLDEGSVLSYSGGGSLSMKFSEEPTYDKITFSCGGKTLDWSALVINQGAGYFQIAYGASLREFVLANPSLSGTECQISFEGLRSATNESKLYNGTGKLTLKYELCQKVAELVSQNIEGNVLKSWYRATDEDRFFEAEFDENIAEGTVVLGFGNVEADGEYYQEVLTPTFDGKKISVDLSGVLRRPENMVNSATNYGEFYVKLQSFKDANGNYVYSTAQGSIGSFSYTVKYELINTDLGVEFTPANGSEIAGVDKMEIYLTPYEGLLFDGVKMTWEGNEDGVLIPLSNITSEKDAYNGCALNFNIPAAAKTAKNVEVSLSNFSTPDGLDHSSLVRAKYNSFVILSSNPANDSTLGALLATDKVSITCNNDQVEVGYMVFEIIDVTDDEVVKSVSAMTKQTDGSWAGEMVQELPLYLYHTYHVNFTAYANESAFDERKAPIGDDYIVLHGSTLAFSFSPVVLKSIDPADESDITSDDQLVFTVEFDGDVVLEHVIINYNTNAHADEEEAEELPAPEFKSVAGVDPNEGYAKTWVLTLPDDFYSTYSDLTMLTFSFSAYDAYGKVVEGNMGSQENSYFQFNYYIKINSGEETVNVESDPADGAELTETPKEMRLTFTDAAEAGIGGGKATIAYSDGGEGEPVVNNLPDAEYDFEADLNVIIQPLGDLCAQGGQYTVSFPAGYFILDEVDAPAFSISFSLATGGINSVLAPADGSISVYNLQGVCVLRCENAAQISTLAPGIYIINGAKVRISK